MRKVSANILPASSAKELACSRNMPASGEAVSCRTVALLTENGTCHAQAGILRKLGQQELKVITLKRNVRVHVPDDIKRLTPQCFVPCIESMCLSSKAPAISQRPLNQRHPRV